VLIFARRFDKMGLRGRAAPPVEEPDMIKLSTKGRYGTRLMVNLARHYTNGQEAIILKNVSEEEGISIRYLEQIIIPLKIAKLVKSIRGAGGGYTLARRPSEIKLCDILHALEGTCSLVECLEDETYCDKAGSCGTYEIWKGATDLLKGYFDRISLEEVLAVTEAKSGRKKPKPKPA
jgi:Rrf2 family protein